MKKMLNKVSVGLIAGAMTALPLVASAQEEAPTVGTVGIDFSSAYVFRGVTLNDEPVAQPYLEAEIFSGLTVGTWANFDIGDYGGTLEDGQFSEVDLYVKYTLPVEGVSLTLGYFEYTYPGSAIGADREISLSAGLDLPLSPSLSIFYGLDGAPEENIYLEAGIGHSVEVAEGLSLNLAVAAGYLEPDMGEGGFHQWSATAKLSYEFVTASVTYVGQLDDDVLTDEAYDVELVGTISLSKAF
jgi:uncharacterized protein (TIGR02001 family)